MNKPIVKTIIWGLKELISSLLQLVVIVLGFLVLATGGSLIFDLIPVYHKNIMLTTVLIMIICFIIYIAFDILRDKYKEFKEEQSEK